MRNGHIRSASHMRNTHTLLVIMFLLCVPRAWAQNHGELNINDVRARFYANGRVAFDPQDNLPHFEVPQGVANANYSGGLWIGGQTVGGQPRISSTLYDMDNTVHFFPGPLRITDGTTDENMSQLYDRVWSVSREQIATHLAYYNCASDPNCDVNVEFPNGYIIPPVIVEWPAIGDITDGYELYLAPFYDYNADGNYVAADGDAPCILGDQALFSVFGDNLGLTNGNLPLNVEVQQMPFAYNAVDPALDQTVFVRYHMINRGTQTYTNTMLGFFNDFDLGCADDDFIGCDPSRNLAYVYNWDDIDQDCLGALGYHEQPPAFGMVLLKGPLVDADGVANPAGNLLPAFNGQGFGDADMDNERHGLSHFIYFNRNGPSCCNDPYTTADHFNYLRGIWKDGVTMSYGGVGYNPDPNALACAYMFPGSGDPVGAGTGGIVQGPWSESAPTPALPDRRGLMSMGEFVLEPGEHMDLLFAYVYARAASGGAFASVGALQARVDSVRDFAATLPIWNIFEEDWGPCDDYALLGIGATPELSQLALFPSPATDAVQFRAPGELIGGKITVRDATGRILMQQRVLPEMNMIDISNLANGVYTCEAVTPHARFIGRIVKE